MANEITLNASLAYADSEGADEEVSVVDLLASVASKKWRKFRQSVATSETAIQLGDVSAPGWCLFINRDPTNFIELRVGTGGAKFAKLRAGEFALLRLGSGAQVPYAIADTAACDLDSIMIST